MEKLNTVYLSLGSDLGDRKKNISGAIELIEKTAGKITKESSVYESKPLGFKSDTLFYNLCIEVETTLTPIALLKVLQKIELKLGRIKDPSAEIYASRIIDIDKDDLKGYYFVDYKLKADYMMNGSSVILKSRDRKLKEKLYKVIWQKMDDSIIKI